MNKSPLKNQRGVAILMAMFFLFIMSFLAMSISYETLVDYNVSAQKVNRLKAYYAAKAGAEISLLRVLLYKKAVARLGSTANVPSSMLDPIWNFPFAWPPSGFIPEDTNVTAVTKDQIKSAEKDSIMDSQYLTSIESEGAKIDINDLGSESKGLRQATANQILKIFTAEIENNEEFAEKYDDYNFPELINNMTDWVDADDVSLNGGDEKSLYNDLVNTVPDSQSDFIPPNQAFKSFDEIHMVKDMTDEFVQLLKNKVTIYGAKGINVNYTTAEILQVIDPQMTKEVVAEVLKRRDNPQEGGPFADLTDFQNFLSGQGVDINSFNEDGIPLYFNAPYNFKITSTGSFGKTTQEITTITYDFDNLRERYIEILEEDYAKQNQPAAGGANGGSGSSGGTTPPPPKTPAKKKNNIPKGRPNVVYWQEN